MLKISTKKSAKESEELSVSAYCETEDEKAITLYSSLTSLDEAIDGLVLHYKTLAKDFPEYSQLFEGLVADMLQQKGQISALRDDVMCGSDASSLAQGKEAARYLLEGEEPGFSSSIAPYVDKDEEIINLISGPISSPESAKEDVENGTTKEEILSWLSEHEQAARDFVSFFEGHADFVDDVLTADETVTAEDIENWIYDHDELSDDYARYFGENENAEEYIILAKESDDPEEAFLEYRYPDKLMAQGTFFGSTVPTAFLVKENGLWRIEAMSAECEEYRELLDEQISLLNEQ